MTQTVNFMKVRKKVIRYSQAFKREVVDEIDKEGLGLNEARRRYGVKGIGTIENWIRQMGNLELLPRMIRVEKPDEKDRIKELEKQIRQLKEALSDTQVKDLIAETQLEIVCRQQGLDAEKVKKKLPTKFKSKP